MATGGRSTGGVGIGRGSATVNISRIGETTPRVFRSQGGVPRFATPLSTWHTRGPGLDECQRRPPDTGWYRRRARLLRSSPGLATRNACAKIAGSWGGGVVSVGSSPARSPGGVSRVLRLSGGGCRCLSNERRGKKHRGTRARMRAGERERADGNTRASAGSVEERVKKTRARVRGTILPRPRAEPGARTRRR